MESAPARAHRGTRTVTSLLTIVGYVHSLAAFGAAYAIVHDVADSHERLYGLPAGLGAALTTAIPYVVVITVIGLLREIAENTATGATI